MSLLRHRPARWEKTSRGQVCLALGRKRFPDQTGAPGAASQRPEKMSQKLFLQTPKENYSVMVMRVGGGEGTWLRVPGLRLGEASEALAKSLHNQSK